MRFYSYYDTYGGSYHAIYIRFSGRAYPICDSVPIRRNDTSREEGVNWDALKIAHLDWLV